MEAIITTILTKAFTEYGLLVALLILLVGWLLTSFKKVIDKNTAVNIEFTSKLSLILDAISSNKKTKE